jgi:hypothetical protein
MTAYLSCKVGLYTGYVDAPIFGNLGLCFCNVVPKNEVADCMYTPCIVTNYKS